MPSEDEQRDPVHATLVAILQQLNRAESIHEGQERRQTLELREIERLLSDFWAIRHDHVKIPLVLGLLVRNGMVEARPATAYRLAPEPPLPPPTESRPKASGSWSIRPSKRTAFVDGGTAVSPSVEALSAPAVK